MDFTEAERAHAAGELERAAELYRAGLSGAGPQAAAAARSQLGGVLQELGRLDEAVAELELAVEALEGSDLARASNRLGVVHRLRGDLSAAGDCHERARAAAAEVSDLAQQGVALRNLVEVAASQGDVKRAAALAGEAARILAGANDLRGLGAIWRRLGELALETGRLEDALRACQAEVDCRKGRARSLPLSKAARLAQLLGHEADAERYWSALEEFDPRAAGLNATQLRAFLAWNARRTMEAYSAMKDLEPFRWPKVDAYVQRMRTAPDAEPLRAFVRQLYGAAWAKQVMGF